MLITFLLSFFGLVSVYLGIAAAFVVSRFYKIINLHEEHLLTRSREHKTHTKTHALNVHSDVIQDFIWPVSMFRRLRSARAWLKS